MGDHITLDVQKPFNPDLTVKWNIPLMIYFVLRTPSNFMTDQFLTGVDGFQPMPVPDIPDVFWQAVLCMHHFLLNDLGYTDFIDSFPTIDEIHDMNRHEILKLFGIFRKTLGLLCHEIKSKCCGVCESCIPHVMEMEDLDINTSYSFTTPMPTPMHETEPLVDDTLTFVYPGTSHVQEPSHGTVDHIDWTWVRENIPEDCVKYDDSTFTTYAG